MPINRQSVKKRLVSIGAKKCCKNTMAVLQKPFISHRCRIMDLCMYMSPKQNNSPPCGSSNPSQVQRNLMLEKSLRSKWSLVSLAKLVVWRLFHLSHVGPSIRNGSPQSFCGNSKNEQEKTNHCSPHSVLGLLESWANC